jgi:hypothetical protein
VGAQPTASTEGRRNAPRAPNVSITLVNPKDETDIRSFHVGENLRDALQYIRFEDKPRTFWIDAICINQIEDPKKATQKSISSWQ